jgi:hypothetical protein
MSLYSGNLQPLFNELLDLLKSFDFKLKGNPFVIIHDRLGHKYLIQSMNLKKCIIDNHIIFNAYYKNSELLSEDNSVYSVALPVDLYAGIEIHSKMPKGIEDEYGRRDLSFRP